MKGMMPLIWLGIIAIGMTSATAPVAYDHFMGNQTMPDDAMYGLETAGENIKCALSADKPVCFMELAREREREIMFIEEKMRTNADIDIDMYRNIAEETRKRANELRALVED